MLSVKNLRVNVEGKPILKGIDLEVKAGEVLPVWLLDNLVRGEV